MKKGFVAWYLLLNVASAQTQQMVKIAPTPATPTLATSVPVTQGPAINEDVVDCIVRKVVFDLPNNEEAEERICSPTGSSLIYDIPSQLQSNQLLQPNSHLRIHGAHVYNGNTFHTNQNINLRGRSPEQQTNAISENGEKLHQIIVDPGAQIEIIEDDATPSLQHRHLLSLQQGGKVTKDVLVVRVTAQSVAVQHSSERLSEIVFGSYGTPKAQFEACSMGKFILEPARGTHIHNGVLDLHVPVNHYGKNALHYLEDIDKFLQPLVEKELDSYGHIMYCMPEGSKHRNKDEWSAFATVGHNRLVMNEPNCLFLSTQIHELGE